MLAQIAASSLPLGDGDSIAQSTQDMRNMTLHRLDQTTALVLCLLSFSASVAAAQILAPQPPKKFRGQHTARHTSRTSTSRGSIVSAENPSLTAVSSVPLSFPSSPSSGGFAQNALPQPLKSAPEFARPASPNLLASAISTDARFAVDHVVLDRDQFAGSLFALAPAPPHDSADRLNDPEFYAHHIPGAGQIIEKILQKSKAHPRLTHVFEVIQPEFF